MKSLVSVLAIQVLFLLVSCEKSESSNNTQLTSKVKSVIQRSTSGSTVWTDTLNILYNAADQITGYESIRNPGIRVSYEPPVGNRYTYKNYANGAVIYQSDAFHNSSSLVDSIYQVNKSFQDTTSIKYQYNSSNQVVSSQYITRSPGGTTTGHTTYSYDNNGNLIEEVKDQEGSIYKSTYTYDIDVPILYVGPLGYTAVIRKQLPTKVTFTSYNSCYDVIHSYSFDDLSRLVKDSSTFSDRDQTSTTTYVYY